MIFIPMALAVLIFGSTALLDSYSTKNPELEHYTEAFYDEVGFEPSHQLIRLEYYENGKLCTELMDWAWFGGLCTNHSVVGVCSRFYPYAVIEISDFGGNLYDRKGRKRLRTEQLLLHELGHLYGLKHTEDEGGPKLSLIMTTTTFPIYTSKQLEEEKQKLIRYIQKKIVDK